MNSEKRLMAAVSLSVLIIIAYQVYMKQYNPQSAGPPPPSVQKTVSPTTVQTVPEIDSNRTFIAKELVNERVCVYLTDDGARVNGLSLSDYSDKNGLPQFLIRQGAKLPSLFSISFLPARAGLSWHIEREDSQHVVFKAFLDGISITKIISLSQHTNQLDVVLIFNNRTNNTATLQYQIYNGSLSAQSGHVDSRYIGTDICLANKVVRRGISGKTLKGGELVYGNPAWLTTRGRYFSFIMKPGQPVQSVLVESETRNDLLTSVISNPIVLMPNNIVEQRFAVYAGPNDINKMLLFDPTAHAVINYGFFHGIGKILFDGLKIMYNLTHNYGVAIILLSLLISIIMFPLTRKSLQSMKEMQKIQPETELIRKQFSDNPQKMNKEIMELYKRHKINPLGGCLPMFLQIPIFFSLYQVLLRSVELKGSAFLWIRDLAEPDAAFQLPPAMRGLPVIGASVNILPILMAIAMVFQQKLSQGGGKQLSEQQRIMALIMPVMFGMIFYNMPSGLVLYWFTNTVFMLLLQEVVLKLPAFSRAQSL